MKENEENLEIHQPRHDMNKDLDGVAVVEMEKKVRV